MSTKTKPRTRRETIILLVIILSAIIAYPAVKAWQQHTAQPQPTPCKKQLLRVDAIITQITGTNCIRLTNFANIDALKPYTTNGEVLSCPEGGNIRIGLGNMATTCSKHGPVMLPADPPPDRSILEIIGLMRVHRSFNPRNTCIRNLKQIDGAIQQWALENKKYDADLVDILASAKYLKNGIIPNCPAGGKYVFNVVSNTPYCTVTGHSLP